MDEKWKYLTNLNINIFHFPNHLMDFHKVGSEEG